MSDLPRTGLEQPLAVRERESKGCARAGDEAVQERKVRAVEEIGGPEHPNPHESQGEATGEPGLHDQGSVEQCPRSASSWDRMSAVAGKSHASTFGIRHGDTTRAARVGFGASGRKSRPRV